MANKDPWEIDQDPWEKAPAAPAAPPSLMSRMGDYIKQQGANLADIAKNAPPIGEAIPFLGELAGKAGSAGAAGLAEITSNRPYSDLYNEFENKRHNQQQDFAQQHPIADIASHLIAAPALPMAAPEIAATEGAGMLANLGRGALNAGSRVATNAALTAADTGLKGGDIKQSAKDALSAGALLEGAGLGVKGAVASGSMLSGMVGDMAALKAFKAAAGNSAKAAEGLSREDMVAQGRQLLNEGIVSFGDSAKNIMEKAQEGADEAWNKIVGIFKKTGDEPLVDGNAIGMKILDQADQIGGHGNTSTIKELQDQAGNYINSGQMTLSKAQQEKNSWKFKPNADFDARNIVKSAVGTEMENAVNKAEVPGLGQEYADAKASYGANINAAKNAERTNKAYEKNNSLSLGDKAAAGLVAMVPGIPGPIKAGFMAAAAGTNKLIRNRGNATAAASLDKMAQIMDASPQALGKFSDVLNQALQRGPSQLATTHEQLLQNPEYRRLLGIQQNPWEAMPTQPPGMADGGENLPASTLEERRKAAPEAMRQAFDGKPKDVAPKDDGDDMLTSIYKYAKSKMPNSTAEAAPGYAHGGIIPGKPLVLTDSPVNDTVNVKLSPGEAVIPRTVMNDLDKLKDYVKKLKESERSKGVHYG